MTNDRVTNGFLPSLGLLAGGVLLAFLLPAVHASASAGFFGGFAMDLGLKDLLGDYPADWAPVTAGIGLAIAALAAIPWSDGAGRESAWVVTIGSLTALIFPLKTQLILSDAVREASDQGVSVSESLGSGLIIASIACVVAAALPWWQLSKVSARPTPSIASTPPWMGYRPLAAQSLTLHPDIGTPGTVVQASLTGFTGGSPVRLLWSDGALIANATHFVNGACTIRFEVLPTALVGHHVVEAVDAAGRRVTAGFTVEPAPSSLKGSDVRGTVGEGSRPLSNRLPAEREDTRQRIARHRQRCTTQAGRSPAQAPHISPNGSAAADVLPMESADVP